MMMNLNLSMLLFMTSCIFFCFYYNNILLTLISLEFIVINTMYTIYTIFSQININFFYMLMILTLFICEAVLAMSLIIYMIRSSGNDYFNTLKSLKW